MSHVVRSRCVLAPLLAALVLATTAGAAPGSASDQPAFDQYVPSLPTADGRSASPAGDGAAASLPPALRARLARQPDGALLRAVAEDQALGAPPAAAPGRRPAGAPPTSSGEVGSALWGAAGRGAGPALVVGLVVVLLGGAIPLARRARIRRARQ